MRVATPEVGCVKLSTSSAGHGFAAIRGFKGVRCRKNSTPTQDVFSSSHPVK